MGIASARGALLLPAGSDILFNPVVARPRALGRAVFYRPYYPTSLIQDGFVPPPLSAFGTRGSFLRCRSLFPHPYPITQLYG